MTTRRLPTTSSTILTRMRSYRTLHLRLPRMRRNTVRAAMTTRAMPTRAMRPAVQDASHAVRAAPGAGVEAGPGAGVADALEATGPGTRSRLGARVKSPRWKRPGRGPMANQPNDRTRRTGATSTGRPVVPIRVTQPRRFPGKGTRKPNNSYRNSSITSWAQWVS